MRNLALVVSLLVLVAACGGGGGSPTAPTPNPTPTPDVTETRIGTAQRHQLAFVNFQMGHAGLVTLRIEPLLFLTLRAGSCPESCGDFIANSDSGSLTIASPAGVNSVTVGNPFDDDRAFTYGLAIGASRPILTSPPWPSSATGQV